MFDTIIHTPAILHNRLLICMLVRWQKLNEPNEHPQFWWQRHVRASNEQNEIEISFADWLTNWLTDWHLFVHFKCVLCTSVSCVVCTVCNEHTFHYVQQIILTFFGLFISCTCIFCSFFTVVDVSICQLESSEHANVRRYSPFRFAYALTKVN